MKYKIEWVEVVKTGVGEKGPWKKSKMSLTDETGKKEENVSTFQDVMMGQELEGVISYNEQYKSKEFKSTPKQPTNAIYNKTAQVEKVMERKEASIGKFQDNKDWSIMTSSTMRDAVLLAIEESKTIPDYNFESGVLKWRNWLINNWEVNETDKKPF